MSDMRSKMKNIVLIGFMGSGKTTVGKVLAVELGYHFVDTDDLIETNEGVDIPTIFKTQGETYFRQSETAALKRVMDWEKYVVSTGGGIVTIPSNQKILNQGIVVYLEASPQQIYDNVKHNTSRPLLKGENVYAKICRMLKDREMLYKEAAHYTIQVDGKTPQEICTLLLGGIA